jgi:CBS domain-containing protein
LDRGEVITVTNDVPLLKAFTTILSNKITGLAVVDMVTGELVNNLSVSDLKGLSQLSFYKLEVPIHQIFMYDEGRRLPPVTCSVNTSVGEILKLLVQTKVHRVYVVDVKGKPLNVITLTDILGLFTTRPTFSSTSQ